MLASLPWSIHTRHCPQVAGLKEAGAADMEALVAANKELQSRLASQKVSGSSCRVPAGAQHLLR